MRRARPQCFVLPFACLVLFAAGCGGQKKEAPDFTLEVLPDTAGLSQGGPVVDSLAVERLDGGALRVRGRVNLPDGTRLQVAIRRSAGGSALAMTRVVANEGRFESSPLVGDQGPLPPGRYRFEILAHFTPDWQSAEVLRSTDEGRTLRGPGITRSRQGNAAFFMVEELKR
jgi:hypothetical protein